MEIKYVNACESIQEMNKILWKITSNKAIKFLIVLFVIGLFLSVYGAIHSEEYSKSSSAYSESDVQILSINNYSNRHISESIGIVLVVLSIVSYKLHIARKKMFFQNVDDLAKRFLHVDNQYTIHIDENFVEYKSLELYMKIKWVKFLNYKTSGNFIFMKFETYASSIAIDKRLLTQTDLHTLFELFKTNGIQEIK